METKAGQVMKIRKITLIVLLLLIPSLTLVAQVRQIPIVAILDMTGEGVAKNELGMVRNLLTYAISDSYMAEAVSGSELERLLSETDDAPRNCTDITCALEVGRLSQADVVIAGSLKRLEDGLVFDLQAVDVASAEVSEIYSQPHKDVENIVDNINAIALRLVREFTGERFPGRFGRWHYAAFHLGIRFLDYQILYGTGGGS